MEHVRPSRPDSSLGFQIKVLEMLEGVPSWLASGFAKRLKMAGDRDRLFLNSSTFQQRGGGMKGFEDFSPEAEAGI